ncbi:hypothetical protein O181_017908 [Austropuccinia psidii MF-1]|uniref:Reverse transcriptase domain-containing protein n=1 Tax=Austropuccinia psidii MF-1 TaxID=1389203 RepID=A0A9Q3GS75_9BASI|nr:hypothetical protein [Austropuccinia psidii MF-1]
MCKNKPARGKGYTSVASCITSILINDIEARVNLNTGAFCTCVDKDYLQAILPGWKNHLLPIEGVQFSSASINSNPLGILDTNLVFPQPSGSVRMKTEIVVMNNCTSQHINLGNYYLTIYGIDIKNHKDRYATIGENKRHKFAFSNMQKQISILSSVKETYKDEFVDNQLVEAQINQSLSPKVRKYPSVLRRPAYPSSPRAREALGKQSQELIQLCVLRKVGHNEEFEVTTPVISACHNDKSRMVGDFRALNTYKVPDRHQIPRIQVTLTQLSKAKYITSMDALKGLHQKCLMPKTRKLLRTITHCGIYEYLRRPCGIKNAPSHYQIMMNSIFPTESSEGWLIIYIDYIMIFHD